MDLIPEGRRMRCRLRLTDGKGEEVGGGGFIMIHVIFRGLRGA